MKNLVSFIAPLILVCVVSGCKADKSSIGQFTFHDAENDGKVDAISLGRENIYFVAPGYENYFREKFPERYTEEMTPELIKSSSDLLKKQKDFTKLIKKYLPKETNH